MANKQRCITEDNVAIIRDSLSDCGWKVSGDQDPTGFYVDTVNSFILYSIIGELARKNSLKAKHFLNVRNPLKLKRPEETHVRVTTVAHGSYFRKYHIVANVITIGTRSKDLSKTDGGLRRLPTNTPEKKNTWPSCQKSRPMKTPCSKTFR